MSNDKSWMRGFVRGYIWKIRMHNGAIFEKWTSIDMTRQYARKMMMGFANGDFSIYDNKDVDALWVTKGGK